MEIIIQLYNQNLTGKQFMVDLIEEKVQILIKKIGSKQKSQIMLIKVNQEEKQVLKNDFKNK